MSDLTEQASPGLKTRFQIAAFLSAGALIIFLAVFGEITPVSGGFGWDGLLYGDWARDWPGEVLDKVDTYHIQRVLPSLIVFGALKLIGADLSPDMTFRHFELSAEVLLGFRVYNVILLLLGLWFWIQIINRTVGYTGIRPWLGLVILLINFCVLREFFFVPVSTDPTAFFLAILMLWLYLTLRPGWLLALTVPAAFCWPLSAYFGYFLFIFRLNERPAIGLLPQWVSALLASLVCLIFGGGMIYVGWIKPLGPLFGGVEINRDLVFLSYLLSGLTVFFGSWHLLTNMNSRETKPVLIGKLGQRMVIAAISFLIIIWLQWALSNGRTNEAIGTPLDFLLYNFREGLVRPAAFIVAHSVYYGPAFLLFPVFWARMGKTAGRLGWGILWICGLSLLVGMTTESREWVMSFPFLCWLLLATIREDENGKLELIVLTFLSVLFVKPWMPLDVGPVDFSANPYSEPLQRYMMQHGPWMSESSYWWQGLAVIVVFAVLLTFCVGFPRKISTPPDLNNHG